MSTNRLDFIDTTLRDGNQSLWGATGLRTGMMLEIAPDLDRAGYRAIDFTTSTHMAVTVRFHKENPWERIRLMKALMPRTPQSFLSTGMRFISWETAHPELMDLSYRLLVRNGIERFMVMDPMNNMQAVTDSATAIAAAGAREIVGAVVYTVSPETVQKFQTGYLGLTLVFPLYGIFRYLYLVHQKAGGGSPADMLLNDRPLLACVALWAVSVAAIIYGTSMLNG